MNMYWTKLVIHVCVCSTWYASTEEVGSVCSREEEAGGTGRLYQKYDLCAVHADERLILRAEGEFMIGWQRLNPKARDQWGFQD